MPLGSRMRQRCFLTFTGPRHILISKKNKLSVSYRFHLKVSFAQEVNRGLKTQKISASPAWASAPLPPACCPGLRSLAAAPSRVEAAPPTQNEVFVWSLPPGYAASISLSHHLRSGWQAPGQLVGGYYVSISLVISKSLGKQEGIRVKELDPGCFVSLSSKAGSADCSKKSRLCLSCQERSFSSVSRGWAGRLRS